LRLEGVKETSNSIKPTATDSATDFALATVVDDGNGGGNGVDVMRIWL
jgi:hypothetical protein